MKFKVHKKIFRFASLPVCYIAFIQDEDGDVEITYNDDYTLGNWYLTSDNDRTEIARLGFPIYPPKDDLIEEKCGEVVEEVSE